MRITSVAVRYVNVGWDSNEVEVRAYINPTVAGTGEIRYRFFNVSEPILGSIMEWIDCESYPQKGKTGYVIPQDSGWIWHSGTPVVYAETLYSIGESLFRR